MVTGVLGAAGESAVGRVMEGRCGGTARVITLGPPTEEEFVGGQTPRSRDATLTCVLVSSPTGSRANKAFCLVFIVTAPSFQVLQPKINRQGHPRCTFSDHLLLLTIPFLFPVDGSWGNWHSWGLCSASCGRGEKTRKRLCNNPEPSNSGRSCPGDATQVSRCNLQACPGKQPS